MQCSMPQKFSYAVGSVVDLGLNGSKNWWIGNVDGMKWKLWVVGDVFKEKKKKNVRIEYWTN